MGWRAAACPIGLNQGQLSHADRHVDRLLPWQPTFLRDSLTFRSHRGLAIRGLRSSWLPGGRKEEENCQPANTAYDRFRQPHRSQLQKASAT